MGRFARWAGVAAAAALLATGCSGGSSGEGVERTGGTTPATRDAKALPASLTSQQLDWRRCKATGDFSPPGNDWRCA